jgi:hypothetical protein
LGYLFLNLWHCLCWNGRDVHGEFKRPDGDAPRQSASAASHPYDRHCRYGEAGGPFSPQSFHYKLSATYGGVKYSITAPGWLTSSPTSGTVTKSAKTIIFEINSGARSLQPNTYVSSIDFNNATNDKGNTTRLATLTVNPKQFKITVEASPKADGRVVGGGTFAEGTSQTVTATPNAGRTFVHWTDKRKVVSTAESYTFTVAGNATLIADFQ